MMRLMLSLSFVSGIAGVADAHTLSSDEGVPMQLGHQLLGLHHLPVTAILLFGGFVLCRSLYKRARRKDS